MSFARDILAAFRDFVYPPLCFVCEKRLDDGAERVCGSCWSSFTPLRDDHAVVLELRDRFKNGAVSDFLSCYLFEKQGSLQDVLHLLKYGGVKTMGLMLGKEIGQRVLRRDGFAEADFLVPVPLHKLKQRERGYNQSEIICRGISDVTGIPLNAKLVLRARYTESQTQLNLQQRRDNVEGAFTIPPKQFPYLETKKIILVDDVITTGSTLNACAEELVKAGAKSVLAASAAVAQ